MKWLKRIAKYALYLLLALVVLTVAPTLFYRKGLNGNALHYLYKKGVYHVHSVFSDGTGEVKEIAEAAGTLGLDFVLLTDHGEPNRASVAATAWHDRVLIVGGSEFSLNCGHLAALGFKTPGYLFPPEPQEAIDEVTADNGVTFIAHPFDKRIPFSDWEVENFTGIEIMSSYSASQELDALRLARFLCQYLVNPNYALLNTFSFPDRELKKWAELYATGLYYGIYALDAHAKLPVTRSWEFRFPSYRAMFRILTVYVKLAGPLPEGADPAAQAIVSALKRGNFFNVIEAIAPANGFAAEFIGEDGGKTEMGGRSAANRGVIRVQTPFIFETRVVVKKDGQDYRTIAPNRSRSLDIAISEPGVYVLEIYAPENHFAGLPWILANPFFIGGGQPARVKNEPGRPAVKKWLVEGNDLFSVEKNGASDGRISETHSPSGEGTIVFDFSLARDGEKKDFWSCLAKRQDFDFTGYTGLCFEARSSQELRYWLEIRTRTGERETWYSHSFLAGGEFKTFFIPFARLHLLYGPKKKPALDKICALFFSINNGLAYPGTSGRLEIKNIGLY